MFRISVILYVTASMICVFSVLAQQSDSSQTASNVACWQNSQCANISGAYCIKPLGCQEGYCGCSSGMKANMIMFKCVSPSAKVGGACSTPADCMGSAVCSFSSNSNSVCNCAAGVATSDGTSCSLVRLGQPCGRNEDCGVGAQCNSSSICSCPPNLQSSDGVSCTAYSPGQACSINSLCGLPGMGQVSSGVGQVNSGGTCASGFCQCNAGYKWASFTNSGVTRGACVPSSAQVNLGAGNQCTNPANYATTTNLQLCATSLNCAQCPEDIGTNDFTCTSGVHKQTSLYALVLMIVVHLLIAVIN